MSSPTAKNTKSKSDFIETGTWNAAFDELHIGICRTDLKGTFKYVNKRFEEVTGYTRDEIIGRNALKLDLFPDDMRAYLLKRITARIGGAPSKKWDTQFKYKDGTWIWVTLEGTIIRKSGVPVGFQITASDITEHKQAEEALLYERNFAESIIKTAQTVVLVLDTQGHIVRFNPYMEEISGYTLTEMQGKDWFLSFLLEGDRERMRRLFLNAIGDIQTKDNANSIVTKDGHLREIEWYDKTLKDVQGNIVGLLSIGQDITERKRAEMISKIQHEITNSVLNARNLSEFYNTAGKALSQLIDTENFYVAIYDEKTDRLSAIFEKDENDQIPEWPAGKSLTGQVIKQRKSLLLKKDEILHMAKIGKIELIGTTAEAWLGVPLIIGRKVHGALVVQNYNNPQSYDQSDIELLKMVAAEMSVCIERKQAEEQIRYQADLLQNVSDAIIATTQDGLIQIWNTAAEKIYGWKSKEVSGRRIHDILKMEYRYRSREEVFEKIKIDNVWSGEIVHHRKDGQAISVRSTISKLTDAAGNQTGLVSVNHDITERKQAEEDISRMAQMLDIAPNSITIHDSNGNFLYANQKNYDLHGYSKDEFHALPLDKLDTLDTAKQIPARMKEISENGEAYFEVEHYRKDGSIIPLEVFAQKTKWGDVDAMISIASDITKRKQANEALKESEAKYRLMVESSQDAIVICQNDKFIFVNDAFATMLGYQKEDLLKKSVKKVSSDKAFNLLQERAKQRSNGEAVADRYETVFKMKDGAEVPVEANVKIIDYKGQKATFAVIRDITKQKEIMAALQASAGQSHGLKNHIPICAGCNKIRDDEKEGNPWVSPPEYITERLPNVNFSHGMCPDCMKKWYPDYVAEKDANDKVS